MARTKKVKSVDGVKGITSLMMPGASLAPITTNLPDTAVSIATQANSYNSLQPTQAYELSPPSRKAVMAIVSQASRAKIRIMTRDGDELTSGPLFSLFERPARDWSTKRFLEALYSWDVIAGEIAFNLMFDQVTGQPIGMIPLFPPRLYPIDPTLPMQLEDIKLWQYTANNGMVVQLPKDCVVFSPGFNSSSHIRGLSPFNGPLSPSLSYQAMRYFKDFYTNNAVPSHLLILKGNHSKKQRDDFEQKYIEQYSNYNNQSQKIFVTCINGEGAVEFEKLDSEQKTGEQINLLKYTDEQIASLLSVPPTVMGNFDHVRFETASIEREMFLEDAVLPRIERMQDVLQTQLVDKYFGLSKITRRSNPKISKTLRPIMDKAFSDNPKAEYIVLLDPSSIPLMTQVQIDKFNTIEALCTKGRLSPNEAAEYLNIELPYNPLRDKIFIPSNLQELQKNMPNDGVLPLYDETNLDNEEAIEHSNDPNQRTMAEVEEDETLDGETTKSLHHKYREIRKHVLQNNNINKLYSLPEIDVMCESIYKVVPQFKKELRKDLFNLKKITKDLGVEERKEVIKSFYNGKRLSYLRNIK